MKTNIVSLENKKSGDITLNENVFGLPVRKDILHRVVNWQLAKRRSGNHKTKVISEIRGTTAKPHRQKGTGRARLGSNRVTQCRGGAVSFGPVVRDHGFSLPKKIRKLGLKTALSAKLAEGKLVILDQAALKETKTSVIAKTLKSNGWSSVLVIDGNEVDSNFKKATANIPYVDVLPQQGANVYDILKHDNLVLTEAAVKSLEERLA